MIKQLLESGYKFMYIPKRNTKTFYATKAEDNFYDDNTEYSTFNVENDIESEIIKILPKNAFLPLAKLV